MVFLKLYGRMAIYYIAVEEIRRVEINYIDESCCIVLKNDERYEIDLAYFREILESLERGESGCGVIKGVEPSEIIEIMPDGNLVHLSEVDEETAKDLNQLIRSLWKNLGRGR